MIMNEEQAKEYCKQEDNTLSFLKSKYGLDFGANNKKPINCIVHNDNNASMFFKFGRLHCFGCGAKLDIFNVIQRMENKSEKDSFKIAYDFFNIEVEREDKHYKSEEERKAYEERKRKAEEETKRKLAEFKKKQEEKALKEKQEEEKQIEVYKQLFEYAKQNKDKAVAYLESRSINKEYAETLNNIGYYKPTKEIIFKARQKFDFVFKTDDNGELIKDKNGEYIEREDNELIIIKIKDNFYIQRFIKRKKEQKDKRYLNVKGFKAKLFNEEVILKKDIVFITEGFFDSLSINSLGYDAIALNSTSNDKLFIDYVKQHQQEISKDLIVILLGDNDTTSGAGQDCNNRLLDKLKELSIKAYIKTDIIQKESVKDMNELLMKDAERAKEVIAKAVEEVKEEVKKEKENFCLEYKKTENDKETTIKITSDREQIQNHLLRIEQPQREHLTTGFKQLDIAVNKGLTTGLYIIGAKAGTGKTAFLLQVSDYIARTQNKKVLFFSLEQGKNALFNRRIARITFENMKETVNKRQYKEFTTADYINLADFKDIEFYGEQYEQNKVKDQNIKQATDTFYSYANNVFTIDDIYTVEDIEKVIMNCINQNEKPVIFIDYLQRLKPSRNSKDYAKFEDKRLFDMCIQRLKDLIKRENLVVFLVSSLNRQAKDTELNAYSGSNEIEFNAEFAGTLQVDESYYKALSKKEEEKTGQKEDIRATIDRVFEKEHYKRLKLSILKQKDGISGIDIDLKQYSSCYYYEEVEDKDSQSQETKSQTETAEQEKPPKKR